MIRRGLVPDPWKHLRPVKYWADDREWVTLPAADFDRLVALLEECATDLEEVAENYQSVPDSERRPSEKRRYENDTDLLRRVRALLKEVGDGEG
jgi:hypothetical protein